MRNKSGGELEMGVLIFAVLVIVGLHLIIQELREIKQLIKEQNTRNNSQNEDREYMK